MLLNKAKHAGFNYKKLAIFAAISISLIFLICWITTNIIAEATEGVDAIEESQSTEIVSEDPEAKTEEQAENQELAKDFSDAETNDSVQQSTTNSSNVVPNIDRYLTFMAYGETSTIGLEVNKEGTKFPDDVQYSTDGGANWNKYTEGQEHITVAAGATVKFKGNNPEGFNYSPYNGEHTEFKMSGKFNVSGSIMSLIDGVGISTIIPNSACFAYIFHDCDSIINVSQDLLPATTLTDDCYCGMFNDCRNLTCAPNLPAKYTGERSYYFMFWWCTSLINAPKIEAEVLEYQCCVSMFDFCINLVGSPDLTSRVVKKEACQSMFVTTKLAKAPNIYAEEVGERAFVSCFDGLTSLTDASINLNAKTLSSGCYEAMFKGCSNLTKAPKIEATTLADGCFRSMFEGCEKLESTPFINSQYIPWGACEYMFKNCKAISNINLFPVILSIDHLSFYYTFENCENLTTASNLRFDDELEILCGVNGRPFEGTFKNCNNLVNSPKLVISLCTYYGYSYMFSGCSKLIDTPQITAKDAYEFCFLNMFQDCKSLVSAPDLPNGKLDKGCFCSMFEGCSGLLYCPDLNSIELEENCYSGMFEGCTSLINAPNINAETLADNCCQWMFYKCSSLKTAPNLPAVELKNGCYSYMFYQCSSLVYAPYLPATTLASACYWYMFNGCISLQYVYAAFTSWSDDTTCTDSWLSGVASNGVFTCGPTLERRKGVSNIPEGWQCPDNVIKAMVSAYSGIYDGQQHGINVDVNRDDYSNLKVFYSYNGVDYYEEEIRLKDVTLGVVNVYYKISADNCVTTEGMSGINISKRVVRAKWNEQNEFVYNAENQFEKILQPTLTNVIDGDDINIVSWSLYFGGSVVTEMKYVGTYRAEIDTISGEDIDNYDVSVLSSQNFFIKPLSVELEWTDFIDVVYDGNDHFSEVKANVVNKLKSDEVNVVSYIANCHDPYGPNEMIEAGNYDTKAIELDNSNYRISEDEEPHRYVVHPRILEFSWSDLSVDKYNGISHTNEAYPSVTNLVGEDECNLSWSIYNDYGLEDDIFNAGNYYCVVYDIDNWNYMLPDYVVSHEYTLGKRDTEIKIYGSPKKTYGDVNPYFYAEQISGYLPLEWLFQDWDYYIKKVDDSEDVGSYDLVAVPYSDSLKAFNYNIITVDDPKLEILPFEDFENVEISEIPDQNCTGKPICPEFDVRYTFADYSNSDDGEANYTKTYVRDVDYRVEYKNNVEPGTATAHIIGIEPNCVGSTTTTFEITGNMPTPEPVNPGTETSVTGATGDSLPMVALMIMAVASLGGFLYFRRKQN